MKIFEISIKFIRFSAVGFSGMLVDFFFTWLFKEIIRINKFVSNAIGFTIAASSNYYFNRIWTFQSTNENISLEFGSFFIISIVGLGINTTFLYLFSNKMKLNFYFAKLLAIGFTTIWNFFANLLFTFN